MQVALIHISDIHLRTDKGNPIIDRVQSLTAAIRSNLTTPTHCVLLVSGDIAFSGKREQYKLADDLIDTVGLTLLQEKDIVLSWEEIYVPGNHDVDLSKNPVSRELLLDNVLSDAQTSTKLSEDKIAECLTAQDDFFAFASSRTSQTFSGVNDRLAWHHILTVDKKTINIRCFNTAWLSRLNEKKNSLLAPIWLAPSSYRSDLDVTMFHHPTGWLETINSLRFKTLVEQNSDLVCTGHEHSPDEYAVRKVTGEFNTYFAANALQDEYDPTLSGFHMYLINLEERSKKTIGYDWKDDIYAKSTETDWVELERSENLNSDRFQSTETFRQWLNNPGAAFTHPRKPQLFLRDIYVYPDISEWDVAQGRVRKTITARIKGKDLAGYVRDNRKVIVYGQENSGKTALTKVLYTDLQELDVVPLRLPGESLTKPDRKTVERTIENHFAAQYDARMFERYRQLPQERKVLIIDDFQKTGLNRAGWSRLIDVFASLAGSLVLVANDSFQMQELRDANLSHHPLLAFKHCQIKEFGQLRRYELIKKWVTLGQEYTQTEVEQTNAVKQAEQVMRVVLGKKLLPHYPLFVLTILQSNEAASTKDTVTGAFSYHYEVLIKAQLAEVKTKLTPDTLITYLSFVAFEMFSDKRKCLDQTQLDTVTVRYQSKHHMSFDQHYVVETLLAARVLERLHEDRYRFSYSYLYYYFVAKFFSTNLHSREHEEDLRGAISYLVEHIHVEDYANIVIFLFYLTNDEKMMQLILAKTKEQYSDFAPCDYDRDFEFTNRLLSLDPPELTLNDPSNPETHLDYRRKVDENSEVDEAASEPAYEDEDRIKEHDIDDYLRINMALKLMQILGQIVRNVPGSITGELKLEIIQEAYLVGLRLMQYIASLMRENVEEVRDHFASLIRKELRIDNPQELMIKTSAILTDLIYMAATGIIQRISNAVGSAHLSETYPLIDASSIKVPAMLIDVAIQLDHSVVFPKRDVIASYKVLEKNYIPRIVLRSIVRDYFYKYPEDHALRQSVCDQLGIKVNEVGFIGSASKKILPKPRQ